MFSKISSFFLVFIVVGFAFAGPNAIHHKIEATVDPATSFIEATDKITIPADQINANLHFLLTSDLKVESITPGVSISLEKSEIKGEDFGMDKEDFESSSSISQNKYAVSFDSKAKGDLEITLKFSGKINHPIEQLGEEYARGFSQTPGLIEERGAYLSGSTYWVPWFNDKLITFDMTTSVPEGWDVVSQGNRTLHEVKNGRQITRWESPELMEEVFLIAAQFHEYSFSAGTVEVMAFLRTPDETMANKYLETTAQYLEMYRNLVGPYPFSKFALVENFWATGYGMPSFTLLGEQIIRFPFILHSSYPHELLHNWWGNSAYVDFDNGNWCEGLTAYMADHLIKEQRGQGDSYRRSILQKYTDYVKPENDFALSSFISRTSSSSEAVGYGKSSMTWDMLRMEVGDENFIRAFQKFYRELKFKRASFDDIRIAFEDVSGKDLKPFFKQWVDRVGAPELKLTDVKVTKPTKFYKLQFTLNQIHKDDAYNLNIPVAISFADESKIETIKMNSKRQNIELSFEKEPLKVQVDPQFNIFRKLHFSEIPPALSKVFGSEKILFLLPSKASKEKQTQYKQLAEIWAKDPTKQSTIMLDSELDEIPEDQAVWVFGENNSYFKTIKNGFKDFDIEVKKESIRLGKTTLSKTNNSFIVSTRHPKNPNSVLVWLTIGNKDAGAGLARKLPHYGKYSYLAFEGDEPSNIAKGQWPAVHSPLMVSLADKNQEIHSTLPKRQALAKLAPVFSADRMLEYVTYLASDELEGRAPGSAGSDKAADYIMTQFQKAGLKPGADDGSFFQQWQEVVDAKGNKASVKNVIGIIPGINKDYAGESVIVSAHYDHLGLGWPDVRQGNEGKIHNGADDNASGVAVMMELANLLGKTFKPQRTVIFVAFTAEESGLMGSRYYVKNMKGFPAKKIMGVLNLDTVGRLGKNKLMVINSSTAREWRFIFMGTSYVTGVESEIVTQDLDASDQVSFFEAGIPAVQFFSGPHSDYHRPGDDVDKIDAPGMVKVATFVRESILHLADRDKPMPFTGKARTSDDKPRRPQSEGGKRATTGSMPDFAFAGEGVKIAALSDDSPAAKAGLKKGDVIIQLDEYKFKNLKEYSNALRNFKPGDKADLTYLRDGKEYKTQIVLGAR
ncbi:MAG: M20/M25/M40 family metallo-hydrolase [Calditrichaeota bacterium]|nr:MAG: M20/M25/M40 family metallo-hydrolase [Calditrichota bacterium]MBL1203855.1 M20/M25/M40 family metallo-hydrolase [Calditrichota bacterium]NOG43687.1 M20/M25/M40 family metallo-hydrolase [Calditrichota bacterium]